MAVEMIARKNTDSDGCFAIQDFQPGDCIIVNLSSGDRVRGVVVRADYRSNQITYNTAKGSNYRTSIESIVMLQGPKRRWLDA